MTCPPFQSAKPDPESLRDLTAADLCLQGVNQQLAQEMTGLHQQVTGAIVAAADAQSAKQAAAVSLQQAQQEVVARQAQESASMKEGVAGVGCGLLTPMGRLVAGGASALACLFQAVYTAAALRLPAGFSSGIWHTACLTGTQLSPQLVSGHVACANSQDEQSARH